MEKPIKKPKNQANMWSTENIRFCEKYIEKQPKTSQNSLFSAVFLVEVRHCVICRVRPTNSKQDLVCGAYIKDWNE